MIALLGIALTILAANSVVYNHTTQLGVDLGISDPIAVLLGIVGAVCIVVGCNMSTTPKPYKKEQAYKYTQQGPTNGNGRVRNGRAQRF